MQYFHLIVIDGGSGNRTDVFRIKSLDSILAWSPPLNVEDEMILIAYIPININLFISNHVDVAQYICSKPKSRVKQRLVAKGAV